MRFLLILVLFTSKLIYSDIYPLVLEKYPNDIFVCTGIASGEIFARAFEVNMKLGAYKHIIAVEEDAILIEHSQNHVIPKYKREIKPESVKSCKIYQINPLTELSNIISNIDEPITFVLASQFPDWINPTKKNNILLELDQIKEHRINKHTILIDYVHFGNISIELIKKKLLEINPEYNTSRKK